MFEVLVFVYENYWRGDACPQPAQLERKLNAVGFDTCEIQDALAWLEGLSLAAQGLSQGAGSEPSVTPRSDPGLHSEASGRPSMRVYSVAEQDQLGSDGLGFITFLESARALSVGMREIVMDRAMASQASPLTLDDLKIIVLLVFWSLGQEPEALVLDELCVDSRQRLAH